MKRNKILSLLLSVSMLTALTACGSQGSDTPAASTDAAGTAAATESAASTAAQTYANVVAVREADKDSAKTVALVKALQSETVKNFIAETYNGAVVAIF